MNKSNSELGKVSLRMLIEHPARGWQRLSAKRSIALHRGAESIDEFANKTIRVAEAYVLVEGNKLLGLQALTLGQLVFDGQGRVDQTALMTRIAKSLDVVPDEKMGSATKVTEDVRRGVLRCLGLLEPRET